jgi:putative transposase
VIDAEKANYPIAFMCRLLTVPRSSFYAWTNRVETPTQARRRALAAAITAEFELSRQTSGCRRITAALNRAGIAQSLARKPLCRTESPCLAWSWGGWGSNPRPMM